VAQNENPYSLWLRIEDILSLRDPDSNWLTLLPPLLLDWSGLTWAFLTEILRGDDRSYYVIGQAPAADGLKYAHPMDGGLAGWVQTHRQPLAKDLLNTEDNYTFIFSQNEPLKRPTSFYGWPMLYNGFIMGSLVLVGTRGQTLPKDLFQFFEALTFRLAAHVHHVRVEIWAEELKGLDYQTGLPHRTNFLGNFENLIGRASALRERLFLKVISISGLGRHSVSHGAAETNTLLRNIATQMLYFTTENWELGHVSFGVFAISAPESELGELDKCLALLKKSLNDWSTSASGQANFIFHEAQVSFPENGDRPENLLEQALNQLARSHNP
jgi:hypothetical protein